MARTRTGSLIRPGKDGLWRARITQPDGTRPVYSLGTTDKAEALRVLRKLASRPASELHELASEGSPTLVRDLAMSWCARRQAQGVAMADKERRSLEMYALGDIGHLPVRDVRPRHVREVLQAAQARGLRQKTLAYIRGALRRLFASAVEDELAEHNPVAHVRTPKTGEVRKERTLLSDEEFVRFVSCAEVDLEMRMLSLAARCEGGMRTGDLHHWDWSMIDREHFAECFIPRSKTRRPQQLEIPSVLAPYLRQWWEQAGRPEAGPVFPVRTGRRAGERKRPENSYAKRLRRCLVQAAIFREPPIEVPATRKGMRSDLGQKALGTTLAPNPRDPLYFETEVSLPVDFHSFRRAFASGLAEAGVNVQHAMHLTAHSDPRVHSLYIARTAAMRSIPLEALPPLPGRPFEGGPESSPIVTARDDSTLRRGGLTRRDSASPRNRERFLAPAEGLEPSTRRLTAACSTD